MKEHRSITGRALLDKPEWLAWFQRLGVPMGERLTAVTVRVDCVGGVRIEYETIGTECLLENPPPSLELQDASKV